MTDRTRLTDKLNKLASESAVVKHGWRRIERGAAENPLLAIITLIDEIIFPVSVSLRNRTGEVLELLVGNRRLRCILGPLPDGLTKFEALCDLELGDWNSGVQDQISGLLRAHIAESPDIWVLTSEQPTAGSVGGGGLSANKLADICGLQSLSRPDVDMVDAFDTFTQVLCASSNGWLKLTDNDVVERAGLEDFEIDDLEGVFELASKARSTATASDNSRPVFITVGGGDTFQMVIAQNGTTSFLARVPFDVAAELTMSWRSAGM